MSLTLSAGAIVSHFQIEREVGRGGMGIVYRARDLSLNRSVALKVLAPHVGSDEKMLARFRREAEAAAQLKHTNIATVYEYGTHEGQPYIAAEWVEGRSLREVLEEAAFLPLPRALRLFNQVASALHFAHNHGVVHRDIKPANILVTPTDHVVLVDFGLAWTTGAATLTASGVVMGTMRYISPEQLQNEPVDGRTDQYCLAITLYEMLTGRTPFETDETIALMKMHLFEPPPPVTAFNPALPAALNPILEKALAKDPADRFENIADFGRAFRAHSSEDEVADTRIMPEFAPRAASSPALSGVPAPSGTPISGEQPALTEVAFPLETPDPSGTPVPSGKPLPSGLPTPSGDGQTLRRARWLIPVILSGVCVLLALFASTLPALAPEATSTIEPIPSETLPEPTLPITETPTTLPEPTAPITEPPTTLPEPTVPVTLTPTTQPGLIGPAPEGFWPMAGGNPTFTNFVPEGLSPRNPSQRWYRSLRAPAGLGLAAGGGVVAYDTGDGVSTGAVRVREWTVGLTLWEIPYTTTITSAPVIYLTEGSGLAAFGTSDGRLWGLNLYDPNFFWWLPQGIITGTVRGLTLGNDGALYAATDAGWLHAIEPTGGGLFWSLNLSGYDGFTLPPAVSSLGIFLSGADQTITAVDPATIAPIWSLETVGTVTTPPMVVEGSGLVVVGTQSGVVHAIASSGGYVWNGSATSAVVGLATDGTRIYATTADGTAYAWDMAGNLIWQANAEAALSAAPLTDGVSVLVATQAGELRYYNVSDGSEIVEWRVGLGGDPIMIAPVPAGGWLFVRGTYYLYAFGP